MNLSCFPQFVRTNFPEVGEASNEDLLEVGEAFQKYLDEKYKGQPEKLATISDITPKTVVMNQVKKNPFTTNGYHPALIIHFADFVAAQVKTFS